MDPDSAGIDKETPLGAIPDEAHAKGSVVIGDTGVMGGAKDAWPQKDETWGFGEQDVGTSGGCCCDSMARCQQLRIRLWRSSLLWSDWLLGDSVGQATLLLVLALGLIFAGAGVWMSTDGTADYDAKSFEESLWMSWGLFFDPGTQTGVAASEQVSVKTVAAMFSILGFLYNLVLLGIIVEWIRAIMDRWTRTKSRVWCTDHILLLGWSEKTLFMLHEVFEGMAENSRNDPVVIVADRDPTDMREEIRQYFIPIWQGKFSCFDRRWRLLRSLHIRTGLTHDKDVLERANASWAKNIIILGRDGNPRHADLETVRNMIALSSLQAPITGRILAEVQMVEKAKVLRRLHPMTEVIHARSAANHILALMAMKPVVGSIISNLCSFSAGEELYAIELPELNGHEFKEACRHFRKCVCIGVQGKVGMKEFHNTRIHLAPPNDRVIEAGERLLVIARQVQDVEQSRERTWHWRKRQEAQPSNQNLTMGNRAPLVAGTTALFRSVSPLASADKDIAAKASKSPLVVIGWPADLTDMLTLLDEIVPAGTIVHLLSERTEEQRKMQLEHMRHPLSNMELCHHIGPRDSQETLRKLPLAEASAILVLAVAQGQHLDARDGLEIADDDDVDDDTLTSDSSCLTILLLIADLLHMQRPGLKDSTQPLQVHGKLPEESVRNQTTRIICELLDPRTDQVLARNKTLCQTATFFRSKALETGLFTMATSEPAVFNTLMLLISPSCPSLQAVPVGDYLSGAGKTFGDYSFWELADMVRTVDSGLLVGWHRNEEQTEAIPDVCPEESKDIKMSWSLEDNLLVIQQPKHGRDAWS